MEWLKAIINALRSKTPSPAPVAPAPVTGTAGTQRAIIETDPELYGPRQMPAAPMPAPPPPSNYGGLGTNLDPYTEQKMLEQAAKIKALRPELSDEEIRRRIIEQRPEFQRGK